MWRLRDERRVPARVTLLRVSRIRRVPVCAEPAVELHVAERGERAGLPLLVVHGGPDWDHSYLVEPLIRLPDRHRVLFPDLRGCGRSSRGLADEQYTWDLAVEDLVVLIDKLGLPTADVLGFSTGGVLALRLALRVPQRVRRLICGVVERREGLWSCGCVVQRRRATNTYSSLSSVNGSPAKPPWRVSSWRPATSRSPSHSFLVAHQSRLVAPSPRTRSIRLSPTE